MCDYQCVCAHLQPQSPALPFQSAVLQDTCWLRSSVCPDKEFPPSLRPPSLSPSTNYGNRKYAARQTTDTPGSPVHAHPCLQEPQPPTSAPTPQHPPFSTPLLLCSLACASVIVIQLPNYNPFPHSTSTHRNTLLATHLSLPPMVKAK